jgi:hypothetical protein
MAIPPVHGGTWQGNDVRLVLDWLRTTPRAPLLEWIFVPASLRQRGRKGLASDDI